MASPTDFEEFLPPDLEEFLQADFEVSSMDTAVPKGNKAMYMLLADSATAGQTMVPPMPSAESGWELVEDLSAAGYVEDAKVHEPDYQFRYEDDMQEMGPFLASMGLHSNFRDVFDPHLGDNSFITHRHTISNTGNSGVARQQSGHHLDKDNSFKDEAVDLSISSYDSMFEQVICPAAGLIVAFDNLSPSSHKLPKHLHDQIPRLRHWSDVAFLQWTMRTELQYDLKYVLRYHVLNVPTLEVIDEIIGTDLRMDWPGVTFNATTLQGQALIGSPNGLGVAYLLIQHKRKLGHKSISAVTIFHPKGYSWMVLFHIVDVVNPQFGVGSTQQAGFDEIAENLGGLNIE